MARNTTPELSFSTNDLPFSQWKASSLPKVLDALGDWPSRVEPNPELVVEWEDRRVKKRRYLIDVGEHISAALQVNLPLNAGEGRLHPAIQCWHGHGDFGKDPVMGNAGNPSISADIEKFHYDYGHRMAELGFVTYAIDWIGRGDRDDTRAPHFSNAAQGRDWCNIYYLHATMLGMTSLSINLAHGKAATDFVTTLSEVDSSKLGVMGLSGGGTMALWSGLTDQRVSAVEVICYSDLWADFGIRDTNYCGMQVAPGLFKLVDVPDLQGLLAPKPLLVDIATNDDCFRVDTAMACFRQVEKIYEAAGARERLVLDLFAGDHSWGGNHSEAFFNQHLRTDCPSPG